MRKLINISGILAWCLATNVALSQSAVTKNFKTDFGAKGDGVSDDSKAWSDAVQFFNEKKGGTLIIPKGVFRVGTQVIDKNPSNRTAYARSQYGNTTFSGVNGLTIKGTLDKAGKIVSVFKFHDKIKYGFFDPATGGEAKNTEIDTHASSGALLTVNYSCRNIVISDLELDGNITKGIYSPAPAGMKGPDLVSIGIASYGAKNLTIKNVYSHHFALDGFYIQTPRDSLSRGKYHATLDGLRSEYNGRQGLSYTVGSHLKVMNSSFKYTGMAGIRISPTANVDVENHDKTNKALSESLFENCDMEGNKGGAGSLNIAGNVNNIVFRNCDIKAGKKIPGTNRMYAVQTTFSPSRNITFDNCRISGVFLMYRKNKVMDTNGMTVFKNCTLTDNGTATDMHSKYPLLHVYDKIKFDNCTFLVHPSKKLIEVSNPTTREKAPAEASKAARLTAASPEAVLLTNCKVVDINTKKKLESKQVLNSQQIKIQ